MSFFEKIPEFDAALIKKAARLSRNNTKARQTERIKKESPYSPETNDSFGSYSEFSYLYSLGLQEAQVTRKALIRKINPELFVTHEGKTNMELMLDGKPPYASDEETGLIVLHHIGQQFEAPFAELTYEEHLLHGNNRLLHPITEESWRNEPGIEKTFDKERDKYWKMRAKGEYAICEKSVFIKPHECPATKRIQDNERIIQEAIEIVYKNATIDELLYFSELAQSYALLKQIGAETIDEFIFKLRKTSDLVECPYCGSKDCINNGFQQNKKEKIRKYKCKICSKTFTAIHKSIISGCKLTFFELVKFIDCLYNGYTLEKTAQYCNISARAAFDIRTKLFYALKLLDDNIKLFGDVVIDETYITVSYKGNHSNNPEFTIPRETHHRGHENHVPGTSTQQVCIVCALDSFGNSVARVAGLGSPTAKKIEYALNSALETGKVDHVYSDASAAIRSFANNNEFPIKQISVKNYKGTFSRSKQIAFRNIQKANSYHSRLKKFLRTFNGISSKLLSGYLYLFNWKEKSRDMDPIESYKELLAIMVCPNLYKTTEEIMAQKILIDATEISKTRKTKEPFRNMKRALLIYKRFASGEKQKEIAKILGIAPQTVSWYIKGLRQHGIAYQTKKDIAAGAKAVSHELLLEKKKMDGLIETFEQYRSLYVAKQAWEGTVEDFYAYWCSQTGLTKQTIKNRISIAKRVLRLRENIGINDTYEYQTLSEKYENFRSRYIQTKARGLSRQECAAVLSSEFGYAHGMALLLIHRIEHNQPFYKGQKTRNRNSKSR